MKTLTKEESYKWYCELMVNQGLVPQSYTSWNDSIKRMIARLTTSEIIKKITAK